MCVFFFNNYKLQLYIFLCDIKIWSITDFPGKLRFVEFVGSSERIASRHDKYPSHRIAEPRRLFSFSLPRSVSRKRHMREYVVRGTNFHRSPVVPVRPLLRRTNFSFCLPAPSSSPCPMTVRSTNSKLISGTRPFFGEREGWVGSGPRATCHREPPGSAGLTLISLLR